MKKCSVFEKLNNKKKKKKKNGSEACLLRKILEGFIKNQRRIPKCDTEPFLNKKRKFVKR